MNKKKQDLYWFLASIEDTLETLDDMECLTEKGKKLRHQVWELGWKKLGDED